METYESNKRAKPEVSGESATRNQSAWARIVAKLLFIMARVTTLMFHVTGLDDQEAGSELWPDLLAMSSSPGEPVQLLPVDSIPASLERGASLLQLRPGTARGQLGPDQLHHRVPSEAGHPIHVYIVAQPEQGAMLLWAERSVWNAAR